MTKLDFPDTPSTGQQYGSSGTVWRWDGTRWGSTAGAAGARGRVAYAQVTADQYPITTETVIAGLTATAVLDPSRTYRATLYCRVADSNGAERVVLKLLRSTTTLAFNDNPSAPNGWAPVMMCQAVISGLSGSHTFTATLQRSVGTGSLTMKASSDSPAFILVEDITYEAGSTPAADPNKPWNVAWGTLGTAAITANQTGYDTVLRDISGLYVTVPTPAFRKLRYTLTVAVGTPSATWVQFHIADAGNNGKQSLNLLANGANATTGTTFCYYNTGTTDPTVTAKVRGSAGVNGWQISANANMPTLLTIEDVGPVTPI